MITADQLLAHAVGDYIIQSDWMANHKTKSSVAALVHAVTYSLPFLLFAPSPLALAVILGTHFVIDRFRVARYVCWLKNWPRERIKGRLPDEPYSRWKKITGTGYPEDRPAWLATWLLIICDNILHVAINGAALAVLT